MFSYAKWKKYDFLREKVGWKTDDDDDVDVEW